MSSSANKLLPGEVNPLHSLDEWEDDVLQRYPDPKAIATDKSTEAYRNYEAPARDTVKEFYRLNHTYQTFDFVKEKQKNYPNLHIMSMKKVLLLLKYV